MKFRPALGMVVGLLLSQALPKEAAAQDACGDVLRSGTLQSANIWRRDFFSQVVAARFASSTYEQSRDNRELGFGIPLGEYFLSGNYSQNQFEERARQFRSALNLSQISSNELSVALASGDPIIVNAWRECMNNKRGMSARFTVVNSREAVLTIEYFGFGGINTASLTEDIRFPQGVTIRSGQQSLRANTRYESGVSRDITLDLPNGSLSFSATVNSNRGSSRAFLPRRLRLVEETRPFPILDGNGAAFRKVDACYSCSIFPSHSVLLPSILSEEGWEFLASSANGNVMPDRAVDGGACNNPNVSVTSVQAVFSYWLLNNNSGQAQGCAMSPTISIRRFRWVEPS